MSRTISPLVFRCRHLSAAVQRSFHSSRASPPPAGRTSNCLSPSHRWLTFRFNPRAVIAGGRSPATAGGGSSTRSSGMAAQAAPTSPRVLSIQSHVVHGHVGNKSAVFPLQLLGCEVDFINSVQFSNHTGYKQWRGTVMSGDQLWELIEGLEMNDLCSYTHLLTGYIASPSFLDTVLKVVAKLREYNPGLVYVCDPVMGDDGQLYISEELVPIYRKSLPAVASVLLPNAFEAEQLTGVKVIDVRSGLEACQKLHEAGTPTVIITSIDKPDSPDALVTVASTTVRQEDGGAQQMTAEVSKLPYYFTGFGDLFAALITGWLEKHPENLGLALQKTIGGLRGVLQTTMESIDASVEGVGHRHDPKRSPKTCKALELRLVQSQRQIADPDYKDVQLNML